MTGPFCFLSYSFVTYSARLLTGKELDLQVDAGTKNTYIEESSLYQKSVKYTLNAEQVDWKETVYCQ